MPPSLKALLRAALFLAVPVAALTGQCRSVDDPDAIEMRDSWRAMLVLGEAPGVWRWLGLTAEQKDSIVLIDDAGLCERAATAIAEFRDVPVGGFTFALMRAGSGYLAQSSDLRINGMQTTYEFNGEMSLRLPRDTLRSYQGVPAPAVRGGCWGSEASKSVLGKVQAVMRDPRHAWIHERFGIDAISPDSVVVVTDQTTCLRARTAIGERMNMPVESVSIVLTRIGRFHWAEGSLGSQSEWMWVFILDSTAGRVVAQH